MQCLIDIISFFQFTKTISNNNPEETLLQHPPWGETISSTPPQEMTLFHPNPDVKPSEVSPPPSEKKNDWDISF